MWARPTRCKATDLILQESWLSPLLATLSNGSLLIVNWLVISIVATVSVEMTRIAAYQGKALPLNQNQRTSLAQNQAGPCKVRLDGQLTCAQEDQVRTRKSELDYSREAIRLPWIMIPVLCKVQLRSDSRYPCARQGLKVLSLSFPPNQFWRLKVLSSRLEIISNTVEAAKPSSSTLSQRLSRRLIVFEDSERTTFEYRQQSFIAFKC